MLFLSILPSSATIFGSVVIKSYATITATVQSVEKYSFLFCIWEFISNKEFLSSFCALLVAGAILTFYNHQFLKNERQHKIADAFCVRLEELIIKYYRVTCSEEKNIIEKEYQASMNAFILFIDKKYKSIRKEADEYINVLLDIGLSESSVDEEFSEVMIAITSIRFLLTK